MEAARRAGRMTLRTRLRRRPAGQADDVRARRACRRIGTLAAPMPNANVGAASRAAWSIRVEFVEFIESIESFGSFGSFESFESFESQVHRTHLTHRVHRIHRPRTRTRTHREPHRKPIDSPPIAHRTPC
ncbi:hypothetical protein [Burkholderia pseudomallei]|uniref:hypothetical protein n=2 Tax=Burkholderia pseudomallei TaxID=28450 RepID=UPI0009B28048|nr:hypothetical protein [Burkholderia pseudomallei]MDV2205273.1 hypothetical protein [Burkholderia pseudomallei]